MKRFLALMILPLTAVAGTDSQCMQECLSQDRLYQYCQSQCSYPDQAPRRVDQACMGDCLTKGYLYNYCQAICAY